MEKQKRVLLLKLFSVILLAALIIIPVVQVLKVITSSYTVIVKDKDLNYFRAGNLFICGDTLVLRRDLESVKDKSLLPELNRDRFSCKILSMKDIISIEIVHDDDAAFEDLLPVKPEFLGRYKIRLQGHEGILLIGVSKERIYGTVKFPQWGKGAVEYLKGVRIGGGEVRFTRSASTPEEIKRLGANYLFKQNFSGKYNSSGKTIKGIMTNDRGERHEWEAVKK